MAAKKVVYKQKVSADLVLRKLIAGVGITAILVILVATVRAGASFQSFAWTVAWKGCVVLLILKVLSVVLVRIVTTYEEISGGQD